MAVPSGAATVASYASFRSHPTAGRVWVGVDLAFDPMRPRSARRSSRLRLTSRDHRTLRWIAEQEAVRTDVVAHLLRRTAPLTVEGTRHVVDRWRRAGLIHTERLLAGAAPVCWLTTAGLRVVRTRHRSAPPPVGRLDHLHAVSLVRLGLEQRGARAWTSERALHRQRASGDAHVADGRFVAPNGLATAVEVELTVKGARRLRAIVDDLTIDYPAVLYVVRGPRVRHAVERAVDALDEHRRVAVVELAQFQLQAGP